MLGEDSRTAASKKKFECGPRRLCFPMQALEIVVRCVFFIKKTAGENGWRIATIICHIRLVFATAQICDVDL